MKGTLLDRGSLESIETFEEPRGEEEALVNELYTMYLDDVMKVETYHDSNWQTKMRPNYQPGCLVQQLPFDHYDAIDYPPLDDFPVCPQLSEPCSRITKPYQRSGAIRRDCFLFLYLPVDCPAGIDCENWFCFLAHSTLEKMFHPLIYRTETCRRGVSCCRRQCSFLHTIEDDIEATNFWLLWENHWKGYRQQVGFPESPIETTFENLCDNSKETARLRSAIMNVCAIRISRATIKEKQLIGNIIDERQDLAKDQQSLNASNIMTPFEMKMYKQILNPILNDRFYAKLPKLLCRRLLSKDNNVAERLRFYEKRQRLKEYWLKLLKGDTRGARKESGGFVTHANPNTAASRKTRSMESTNSRKWIQRDRQSTLSTAPSMEGSKINNSSSDAMSAVTRVTAHVKSAGGTTQIPEHWKSLGNGLIKHSNIWSGSELSGEHIVPFAPCSRNRQKEHQLNFRIASGENLLDDFKPIATTAAKSRRDTMPRNTSYEDLI